MLESFEAHIIDVVSVFINMPFNVGEKFYYLYILTFIGLAYYSFTKYYKGRVKEGFLKFLFPREIYLHESAKVDYGIFLINLFISPLLLIGAGLQAWLSSQVGTALIDLNSGQAIFVGDWNTATFLLFILGYTLAADLSVYLIHRFHHESDIFWPLHALHHSAEVMTPVTLFRKHPIWNVMAHLFSLTLTGLFQGLFIFVFFGGPKIEVLFGINTVYVLYNFFGANLRHSHVWLSWAKPLSYFFISPAMHQIHHDPERMQKNYGEVFGIWDWMFGSLCIPDDYEEFEIGLGKGIENPHDSIVNAYWIPVVEVWQVLVGKFGNRR